MPTYKQKTPFDEWQFWEKAVRLLKKALGDSRVDQDDDAIIITYRANNSLEMEQLDTLARVSLGTKKRGNNNPHIVEIIANRALKTKNDAFSYDTITSNTKDEDGLGVTTDTTLKVVIPKQDNKAGVRNLLSAYQRHIAFSEELDLLQTSVSKEDDQAAFALGDITQLPWTKKLHSPVGGVFEAHQMGELAPEKRDFQEQVLVEEVIPSRRKELSDWFQVQKEAEQKHGLKISTALPIDWVNRAEARSGITDLETNPERKQRVKDAFSIK